MLHQLNYFYYQQHVNEHPHTHKYIPTSNFLFHQTEKKKMEPYNPSSKLARITEHGREQTICDNGTPRSNRSFTFLQIEELRDQVLIYKYIENGIPVPHHLLLPICKSVAHSLSDLKGLGFVGGLDCCNYRKNMEPEPGRCRRTDGKKWRCNKDVARPDQKYCERHLHRGGSRSSAKQQQNSGEKVLPAESVNSIPIN